MKLSTKQAKIIGHLEQPGVTEITLNTAVRLVGRDIYANAEKHVGAILSNMIKRGLIVRVKPGIFRRRKHDDPQPKLRASASGVMPSLLDWAISRGAS